MSLRIRRGTEAQRTGVTFDMGEVVWTTDYQQLWVGDGLQSGGFPVVGANVAGYGLHYNGTSHKLEVQGLSADDITNGTNNKFFSTELAQDAAASLFTTGSHTGISFQYNDVDGKINATIDASAFIDTGLLTVQADTTPHLGGNLVLNGHDITGTGNINYTGTFTNGVLTINNSALISSEAAPVISGLPTDKPIRIGSATNPNTVWTTSAYNFNIATGITSGSSTSGSVSRISRGTLDNPTVLQPGDPTFVLEGRGFDGTNYVASGIIAIGVDPNATITSGHVPGFAGFLTLSATGTLNNLLFDSKGVLTIPTVMAGDGTASNPSIGFTTDGSQDSGFFHPGDGIVCVSVNATEKVRVDSGGMRVDGFMKVKDVAGTLPNPPEAGMIVLDGTTFKGYNGSSWVNLN